jgi:ubiquinone/menaquinone biosynthesis C-methylase UbiE
MSNADVVFSRLASRYDELWTRTTIGRLQREAVWRRVDPLFQPGDSVLDLGCGTGEDAIHFMNSGIRVRAIDASCGMVRIARSRGVDASELRIEELELLEGSYDGVISNFGALNCVEKLDAIRTPLARLVRPGGHLAVCMIGGFCLWETAWYLLHAQPRKAFRRLNQGGAVSSLRVRVYYPSISRISGALLPDFELVRWYGVGIFVPPSYVNGLPERLLTSFANIDRYIADLPPWRVLGDHRLLIFARK